MLGCCSAQPLKNRLPPQFRNEIETSKRHTNVEAWLAALSDVRQRQSEFDAVTTQEREDIRETFARLQTAVARIQTDALVKFDAHVATVKKQFVTELESLEVLGNQTAAAKCAFEYDDGQVNRTTGLHGPVGNVKSISDACLSVVTMSKLRKDVLNQLSEITETANTLLKAVSDRAVVCLGLQSTDCDWQGKLTATYHVGFKAGGLAVNHNASLFAVSDTSRHAIVVHELPSGELQTRFGSKGNSYGEFNGPLRLCFTPVGTLLVADSNNKRVQEVSTRGDHVRFLQSDRITARVMHVTCNADVVVVTQKTSRSWLCVFDMRTGTFIRKFGDAGTEPGKLSQFWDITMTFDGTALLVPDLRNRRISVFGLAGTFLRIIGNASMLESFCSVTELPDGRVVATQMGSSQLAIVGDKDTFPTFVWGEVRPGIGTTFVRYADGCVFFANQDCVQLFR